MEKDLLRRLGWSEELISAAEQATAPISVPPIAAALPVLEMPDAGSGATSLNLTDAPVVGSTALPPPSARRRA